MPNDKSARFLKPQLIKFVLELCGGLREPLGKFVTQMLFGIQASQAVKLSTSAQELNEAIPRSAPGAVVG